MGTSDFTNRCREKNQNVRSSELARPERPPRGAEFPQRHPHAVEIGRGEDEGGDAVGVTSLRELLGKLRRGCSRRPIARLAGIRPAPRSGAPAGALRRFSIVEAGGHRGEIVAGFDLPKKASRQPSVFSTT